MSELLFDIEWFAYNCGITSMNPSDKSAATQLAKYVVEDFQSIKACVECYNNAFEKGEPSFIIPCEKPHLLVWADAEKYGYWPAKVMKINKDSINLRFFGDHTSENLAMDTCYLFSKKRPEDTNVSTLESYKLGLKVSLIYFIQIKYQLLLFSHHQFQGNQKACSITDSGQIWGFQLCAVSYRF